MRLVPRDWPIASRITAGMLIAGIVPLLVVTWFASERGSQLVEKDSYRSLRLVARVTAERIDQFLLDYRSSLRAMRNAPVLRSYLSGETDRRAELQELMQAAAHTDPNIATVFVTDTTGRVLMATNPKTDGRDVSFRDYWKRARAGEEYVSTILVGKHTGERGVYLAGPVVGSDDAILGVAVTKLDAATIDRAVAAVQLEGRGGALLLDADGVILASAYPESRFHTMRPITPERLAEIDPQRKWGVAQVPLLPMSSAEIVRTGDGNDTWVGWFEGERYFGGEAPVGSAPWRIVAYEPESQLNEPVRKLFWQQIGTIALVTVFTLLFVFSHSRSILRPVRRLSQAAERLAQGDLEARADVRGDDELGRLGRSFNEMVPKLAAGVEMKNSLRLAQEVQRNLLPDRPPEFPGVDLAGHSIPADETGGDYFDFIDLRPFGDERLAVAVGDVVGHGVAAALLMATARANLRARARPLGDLAPLFSSLNGLLSEDVRQGQFMTMLLLVYDAASGTARWVNAGHHPPFHFEAAEGTVSERASSNVPLGILPEWDFEPSDRVQLAAGDVLLLGTDGIWEAVNPRQEMFGSHRVARVLQDNAGRGAREVVDALLAALEEFREGVPFHDDVTMVVLRMT